MRVDVVDLAELARVRDRLELLDAGVVDEQVADHQDPAGLPRRRDRALGVGDVVGERLLDEAVLAGAQHALRQRPVGRDRRGQHDRVELRVAQEVVELGREAGAREGRRPALARRLRAVAAPRELAAGDRGEVAREVGPPVAEADDTDSDHVISAPDARVIRIHGSSSRHRPSLPACRLVRRLPVRRRTPHTRASLAAPRRTAARRARRRGRPTRRPRPARPGRDRRAWR